MQPSYGMRESHFRAQGSMFCVRNRMLKPSAHSGHSSSSTQCLHCDLPLFPEPRATGCVSQALPNTRSSRHGYSPPLTWHTHVRDTGQVHTRLSTMGSHGGRPIPALHLANRQRIRRPQPEAIARGVHRLCRPAQDFRGSRLHDYA